MNEGGIELYKCNKPFSLEVVDGDGFTLEDETVIIPEGSIWHEPEEVGYRFIGGEVRLESDDLGWIEICKDTLNKHFEVIE